LLRTFENNWFEVGPFRIRGFRVPHDAEGGCFGYNIHLGKIKVSVATDMGFPENGLAGFFKNSDVIIIESNHDPEMLANSGRSAELIERIHSIGHLSNQQCSRFLEDVFRRSDRLPRAVALAHLSEDCNLPGLARQTAADLLQRFRLDTTQLQVSQKNAPSETLMIFDE
jgi:phosphoribosyl 1,2-cyclic phosphodiesterase